MLINSAKYCTVNQYIECKYENNLSVLGEGSESDLLEAWQKILIEYSTMSGAEITTAVLEVNIANTINRINAVKSWIFIQRDCLQRFGFPLPDYFEKFKKYGHTIKYDGNNESLLSQLQNIENKERQYTMLLTKDKKKLDTLRIAQGSESDATDSRIHFIKMLNRLAEDQGFRIDRDKTTVEELAIMIADRKKAIQASQVN